MTYSQHLLMWTCPFENRAASTHPGHPQLGVGDLDARVLEILASRTPADQVRHLDRYRLAAKGDNVRNPCEHPLPSAPVTQTKPSVSSPLRWHGKNADPWPSCGPKCFASDCLAATSAVESMSRQGVNGFAGRQ